MKSVLVASAALNIVLIILVFSRIEEHFSKPDLVDARDIASEAVGAASPETTSSLADILPYNSEGGYGIDEVGFQGFSERYWVSTTRMAGDYFSARLVKLNQTLSDVDERSLSEEIYPGGYKVFSYLAWPKGIEVEMLKIRHLEEAMAASSAEDFNGLELRYSEEIKSILTSEELFEVQLRESYAAHGLRSIGFDWTEFEFREAVRIMLLSNEHRGSKLMLVNSPLASIVGKERFSAPMYPYNLEIKDLLGWSRYVSYLKLQDPAYARLKSLVTSTGYTGSIDVLYHKMIEANEKVAELLANDRSGEARKVRIDLESEIRRELGINNDPNKESYLNRTIGSAFRSVP